MQRARIKKIKSSTRITGIKKKVSGIVLLVFFLAACTGLESSPPLSLTAPVITSTLSSSPSPVPSSTATSTLTLPPPTPTALATETPTREVSSGSSLPDSSRFAWRVVVFGLDRPVGLVHAGDGSGRIFLFEQGGRILIVQGEVLSPIPFLDISERVGSQGFEQGLLGLAFHPRYAENGFFFVNYTDLGGDTVIARFQVSGSDPNLADPATEKALLRIDQPYRNHNGGVLAFGPDGYLYIGVGDGGSAGDPQNNAQSLNTLLGKILRIDIDHGSLYAVPRDNPWVDGSGLPEIWAYGLRNPWRLAFDRLTGELYIGDVGQNQWEEIDFLPAGSPGGANFGWRYREGGHAYLGEPPEDLELVPPVAEYSHNLGCSVTGGVVYRGANLPEWQGIYLYGDYCSQRVWGLTRDAQGNWMSLVLFNRVGSVASFGEDEAGEVYLVDHNGRLLVLERIQP